MRCPRCHGALATGQEYCLECGLRLPGVSRLGPVPAARRSLLVPILVAAAVSVAGAGVAIALTRDATSAATIVTATGGSETVTVATTASDRLTEWPAATSAWTNVLISVPKVDGRDVAVASALQARQKGLRDVGVLDSSRFASLHPGYFVVFAGIYSSQPEAASRLREAKGAQHGAHTAEIAP